MVIDLAGGPHIFLRAATAAMRFLSDSFLPFQKEENNVEAKE
jgi:hypothetical protein